MLLSIIKFINGYVKIKVYGYSPERFLNLCSNHQVLIWDLKSCNSSSLGGDGQNSKYLSTDSGGNAYEMYMSVKGFRKLRPIVRKTKTRVLIMEKCGMPFLLHRYRKRKMFFVGVVLCSVIIYLFSLFVWDIQFKGNSARTSEVLVKFLEENNLRHGMLKSDIDCEAVETMIRNEFDDIIWTSVEIKGTRLIVYVQESLKIENTGETNSDVPTDLCAKRDGTIESIITRSGTPLVSVGDAVSAGAVLVSGRIDIIGDNGEVVNYQYCSSDADIYIRTTYPYEETFSLVYTDKKYIGEPEASYYVKTFSRKWNLDMSRDDKGVAYEEVSEEKQLHLWNNFYLPFYWGSVTKRFYENVDKTYTKQQAEALANQNLNQFCEDLQKKGVQIIENNVTINVNEKICVVSGSVVVVEKTGESRPTEILQVQPQEEIDEHNGTGT